ncbi:MAG: 30S ribosomal protein S16 [Pseudomonadota bacterium]
MSVRIRLSRGGSKKRPYYRIVIADSRAPRDGRFIERVGHYNPLLPREHKDRIGIDEERVKYWLSQGAQPSQRIHRFLSPLGILAPYSISAQTKKNQPKAKAQERLKAIEEAKSQSKEAPQPDQPEQPAE